MTLKPVKTAAQCAAELEVSDARFRARITTERQSIAAKRKLTEDETWRRQFNAKARDLYASKNAQSRLDIAAASSGTQSTYSVLSELARAGVA